MAEKLVWRFTLDHESDWPTSKGQLFAGVVVPGLVGLVPDQVGEARHPGVVSVNLTCVVRGYPGSRSWTTEFDAARPLGRGLFRRVPAGRVRDVASAEVAKHVSAGLSWLAPLTSLAAVEQALAEQIADPTSGVGGDFDWAFLGALRWVRGDREGADRAWSDRVAGSPYPTESARDFRRVKQGLEKKYGG